MYADWSEAVLWTRHAYLNKGDINKLFFTCKYLIDYLLGYTCKEWKSITNTEKKI